MGLVCGFCKQAVSEELPLHCLHCLVPISPYKEGKFLLPNSDPDKDPVTNDHPSHDSDNTNDSTLTIEDQIAEMIEMLGIEHMAPPDQAVALASLAREKMNLMSADFNFKDGNRLAELAFHAASSLDNDWAILNTTLRLAEAGLLSGRPNFALESFENLLPRSPNETIIDQLRKLEIKAYRNLATQFTNAPDRSHSSQRAQTYTDELDKAFHQMEDEISEYMKTTEKKSEYLALGRREVKFPRLDMFASILVLHVEEAIAAGDPHIRLSDDVLLRMLKLDNVIRLLGEISPPDDPAFFTAQFRDYIRLFNAIFWYGDITLQNNGTTRRLVIETAYERVTQWMKIMPNHFWLSLHPARFLEVFVRAESWNKDFDTKAIMNTMIQESERLRQPNFYYVMAETMSNVSRFEEALQYLDELLGGKYDKTIDPAIKSAAENLNYSISLENIGILTQVTKTNTWLQNSSRSIIVKLEGDPSELKFALQEGIQLYGIAIFGDYLLDLFKQFSPTLLAVNGRNYLDSSWHSPNSSQYSRIEGYRMDFVIIHMHLQENRFSFLFEGQNQATHEKDSGTLVLDPTDLLLLRAVTTSMDLSFDQLINLFQSLMKNTINLEENSVQIFSLKF